MLRRLAADDADDLAQEALVAAWRNIASWRGESGFFPWLATIAWRQFLTQRRRFKAEVHMEAAGDPPVAAEADKSSSIAQAMGRLPDRERMAALLCFAQGYSHGEAAGIMGIPLGTLKSLVARARTGLVQCLEDER